MWRQIVIWRIFSLLLQQFEKDAIVTEVRTAINAKWNVDSHVHNLNPAHWINFLRQ